MNTDSSVFMPPVPDALPLPMPVSTWKPKTEAIPIKPEQVQSSYAFGTLSLGITDMKAVANGLGQGNLWLFNDIAPAHWLYSNYPKHFFDGMDCLSKRDANQLEEHVKAIMEDLPWAAESLSHIKYFKPSPDMREEFEKVRDIKRTENSR